MSSNYRRASILLLAFLLGACSTSATPTLSASSPSTPASSPSPIAVATLAATAITQTPSPAASPDGPSASPSDAGGGAQPTPGSIDPCKLLTTDEASTLMGKKLSAGVSSTAGPLRVCTFKNGLSEVKLFLAPPAPDAATAQAYWDSERAQVPADIPVKDLSVFDRSAFGSGSAGGVSLSALFVIDGTIFFDLFCGFPGCGETASVAAAESITGRLP